MSSTKWRKVLDTLEACSAAGEFCDIKFLSEPKVERSRIPQSSQYVLHHVADGPTQPFRFDQIEWLEIPRSYRPPSYEKVPFATVTNDLAEVRRALERIGKVPLVETSTGLRIVGYQRS